PEYDEAFVIKELGPNEAINMTSADPLYQDVREYVIRTQRASTSSIQRYFGFGYNRAARIIDALELEGIVGPANGSKPREVFYTQEDLDNGRI
ncbi:MAG: DNA translocase FtsK, partial [Erysipelotrichaceae bacterium]|nr:DNA translocase FtsK [Erysipelotrichaceae bacterium]